VLPCTPSPFEQDRLQAECLSSAVSRRDALSRFRIRIPGPESRVPAPESRVPVPPPLSDNTLSKEFR